MDYEDEEEPSPGAVMAWIMGTLLLVALLWRYFS